MTATPLIDSPVTNNMSVSTNYGDQSVFKPVKSGGTLVDFTSGGWIFSVDANPASNSNPNKNGHVMSEFTCSGDALGVVTAVWAKAGFTTEEVNRYNYNLLGSTDSGATYTRIASGSISIVQP